MQQKVIKSAWSDTVTPHFSPLQEHISCDVCVVGAGITGLSTAYFLARRGYSVAVVENGEIAEGETERTTAHLASVLDTRYRDIISIHGEDTARLVYRSHQTAIDIIQGIVERENIACDFERTTGYLFSDEKRVEELHQELEAMRSLGLADEVRLGLLPFEKSTVPTLAFRNQAQFHILKYLRSIAISIIALGGRIYNRTHVEQIKQNGEGETATVCVNQRASVNAKYVVLATNVPVDGKPYRQKAFRTYVIAGQLPQGAAPRGLLWDLADKHYVRTVTHNDVDTLLIGGEDHAIDEHDDLEEDARAYKRLESWGRDWFPSMGQLVCKWSGKIYEPYDGLAYIGACPARGGNILVATGESGMGMTYGTIAAMLFADIIAGVKNPWSEIYRTDR